MELFSKLEKVCPGHVERDVPMSDYTSFKAGGPADVLVTPQCDLELASVIRLCTRNRTPFYLLGNGSNVLFSDAGFRGVVILIKDASAAIEYEVPGRTASGYGSCETDLGDGEYVRVHVSAGCPFIKLAMDCARHDLTGLEFAAGIPGTVGGAVVMNAGAYGGETKDVIVRAKVMDFRGRTRWLDRDELKLGYRTSIIQKKNLIVLEAEFMLKKGDRSAILAEISDLNSRRREKQPLEYPSAGSTFKRPKGYFAGKLIEDAGLRGYSVGDACVSEKHCGFVINRGSASATDISELISAVTDKVYSVSGVRLEPEVRFPGDWR